MRLRSFRRGSSLVAVVVLLLAGCAGSAGSHRSAGARGGPATTAAARPPVKVAWINEGAAVDDAWTRAQLEARAQVKAAYGDQVDLTFVEYLDPGPKASAEIDRLVADGNRLIIATSLAMGDTMADAARRHPDVRFEQARGTETGPNLSTFTGAYEQTAYLVGMTAAGASTTHRLGFVAQYPQPEMFRIIDAYALGARAVDPLVQVEVAWVHSWYDPAREAELTRRLIARGAGAVAATCTGTASGDTARELGVAWSGHDADWSGKYASVWLTASIPDWGPYYVDRVGALLEDRWEPGAYYGTIADGFIDLAPFGQRVSAASRARVEQARKEIVSGRLDPFAGPVRDASGALRVPAGTAPTTAERLAIDYFVEGIVELPETAGA